MKQQIFYGALAAFIGAGVSGTALADSAKTLGGIVVTSDDGNFVGSLGGRIQFDYTNILPDKGSSFDSGAQENDSGFYFRRVYLTLTGKLYGWRYRVDEDFANTSNPANGLKYAFVSHDFGDATLRIGQAKPWRSLDELASDLDTPFTERNINSASGLFGNRQYQDGLFGRYSHSAALLPHDHAWAGLSVYSLAQAGGTNVPGYANGTPTQGLGYNARLAYAPILTDHSWLHIGANFSSEHADNGAPLSVAANAWYSYKGASQTLATFSGTAPLTTSSSVPTNNGGGNNATANISQFELAGAFNSVYLQGEAGYARLGQPVASGKGIPNEQTVYTLSGTASYYLTGETRGYDLDAATYTKPKPRHDFGAVEVAVGYNFAKNRDIPAGDTSVCKPALGAIPAGSTITKCDLSYLTAGVNYYINPNVQVDLDYYYATFDLGAAGKDEPKAINARFQLNF